MENNKSAQEKMEEMIRKYKEEAMKFKERSGLYNEQVPAKEVALQPEKPPAITWREETESIINPNEPQNTEASPTGPKFSEVGEDDGMREVEDILYATGPVSIEDIIRDSHFEQSSVPYSDVGQLQVEVTAATQSIPIPYADVLVLREARRANGNCCNIFKQIAAEIHLSSICRHLPESCLSIRSPILSARMASIRS